MVGPGTAATRQSAANVTVQAPASLREPSDAVLRQVVGENKLPQTEFRRRRRDPMRARPPPPRSGDGGEWKLWRH